MSLRTLSLLIALLLAPALLAADARLTIRQAEQALAAGDDRQAERLMSQVPSGSLDAITLARLQIVRAELALKRKQPRGLLHALPRTSDHVPELAPKIELLRGQGWFMEGNPVYAVRVLTQRERLLKSEQEIQRNRDVIWEGLIAKPIPTSTLTELDRETPMTRGLIDLALVMQNGVTPDALQAWHSTHSQHPAMAVARGLGGGVETAERGAIEESPGRFPADTSFGRGFALLVPTTGELALAGQAVRDGFIAAWFETPTPRTAIRIFDTGSDPRRAVAALEEAQRNGASVVVGPLDRASIGAIIRQRYPLEPWLALNYVDDLEQQPLQFGLAPEDEAVAAARDAIAQGYRHALVLAPANSWGNRAVDSFRQVFELEGGTVLDTERYPLDQRDLTRSLQSLFGIDAAKQRNRELDQILGMRTVFEPGTRHDAQLLYAPLRVSEAQTLRLKLKFVRAPTMPIYMLSAAHQGHLTSQLGGVRLCDMPWVLQQSSHWMARRQRAAQDFPDLVRSQPRLFAFGGDAFRLAQQMERGALNPQSIDAATGQLQQVGRRIERTLGCYSLPEPEPEFSEEALEDDQEAGQSGGEPEA